MHIKTNPKDKMSFNQLYNDYYWENRNTLSEVSNIPAYILTIIKNKSLNYLRHLQIREEHSENIRKYIEWELNARIVSLDACEPYELLVKEMQELIQQTLDKLPERTRKIQPKV